MHVTHIRRADSLIFMGSEHFRAVFWITTYTVLGGIFISSGKPLFVILVGTLYLLLGLFYEYSFLTQMDTRELIKATKKELDKYVDHVKNIKNEIDKTAVEINEIKGRIFDVFSDDPFKTNQERIKYLEEKTNKMEQNVNDIRDQIKELRTI